jgi:hypothetical protein
MPSATELLKEIAYVGGASPESLQTLESQLGLELPASYQKFMLLSDGCDGRIGSLWIILYPVTDVYQRTLEYRESTDIPDAIFIGTDGGGEAYIISIEHSSAVFGSVPFIGDGLADLSFPSPTLDDFVQKLAES